MSEVSFTGINSLFLELVILQLLYKDDNQGKGGIKRLTVYREESMDEIKCDNLLNHKKHLLIYQVKINTVCQNEHKNCD